MTITGSEKARERPFEMGRSMNDQCVQPTNEAPPLTASVRAEGAVPASSVRSLVGVVPEKLIDEGEIVILAIKPSLWFILFYSAKVIVVVVALLAALRHLPIQDWIEVYYRLIYQAAAAVLILQLAMAFLQWLSRLYVLTNRRVIRVRGIFTIDIFETQLSRIQNTFMTLAIHERILGLGSIQFATAGTALIEATWQSVNHPLEVHELIRKAIRQGKGTGNSGL